MSRHKKDWKMSDKRKKKLEKYREGQPAFYNKKAVKLLQRYRGFSG